MNIDKVREERQLQGVEIWIKEGCRGTLYYATGVGKTYTAMLAIQRIEKTRKPIYLITVPSVEIKNQWERKLPNMFNKTTLSRIIVESAQTILSRDNKYEDVILIVDESHEFATEERIKILDGTLVDYKALLCLTASGDDKRYKIIKQFAPIVDIITEEEAIEKGFIEEFVEFNIALSLTANEQQHYVHHTNIISDILPKFDNRLDLAQRCINGGTDPKSGIYYAASNWAYGLAVKKGWSEHLDLRFEEHQEINNLWHPNKIIGYATKLLKAVRNRKDLLNTAESKYLVSRELLLKFNNVKSIVFSESTEFADNLYESIKNTEPVTIYHSKLKTKIVPSSKTGKPIKIGMVKMKKQAIEDINNGKARSIITSKALDKGFDVPDLRLGITTSGSSNPTQYKQRGGRIKRKEVSIFGEDSTVLLINLYIKNTQDEKWLKTRQKNIVHKIYEVTSVEEITFKPKPNAEYIIDI